MAALHGRVRSIVNPLHSEQDALQARGIHLLEESMKESARLRTMITDLTASTLFTRWIESPNLLASRKEAGYWLNWLGLEGDGVEVGVFKGEFSSQLLTTWQCRSLTSIDPWREFSASDYVDTCNASQDVHDRNFDATTETLRRFGARSRILRETSAAAAARFADGSLDFVYLDAQHHYEAVRDDIALWRSKVRAGGVIGGHDYLDGTRPSGLYGVKTAVGEFVTAAGYELVVTRELDWPSWFVRIA